MMKQIVIAIAMVLIAPFALAQNSYVCNLHINFNVDPTTGAVPPQALNVQLTTGSWRASSETPRIVRSRSMQPAPGYTLALNNVPVDATKQSANFYVFSNTGTNTNGVNLKLTSGTPGTPLMFQQEECIVPLGSIKAACDHTDLYIKQANVEVTNRCTVTAVMPEF